MSTTERSDQINADDYKVSYDEDYNDGNKLRKRMEEQFKDVNKRTNDIFKVLKYSLIILLCLLVAIVCLGAVTLTNTQKKTKGGSNENENRGNSPIEKECDKGWFDGSSVGLGCLLFSFPHDFLPIPLPQALTYCEEKDSRLIELDDIDQLKFLSSNTDKMHTFLKLNPKYAFLSGATFNGTKVNGNWSGSWVWESAETHVQTWVWKDDLPIVPTDLPRRQHLAFQHQDGKSFLGSPFPFPRANPRTRIVPLCQRK